MVIIVMQFYAGLHLVAILHYAVRDFSSAKVLKPPPFLDAYGEATNNLMLIQSLTVNTKI